jgi:hypothetical protein
LATGRLVNDTAPAITITIEITEAKIGRLIKNFDMAQISPWLFRFTEVVSFEGLRTPQTQTRVGSFAVPALAGRSG